MGIKEKLPLINSSIKGIRIAGYVLYAGAILVVLGAILLSTPQALAEEKIAMTKSLYTQIPEGKAYDFTLLSRYSQFQITTVRASLLDCMTKCNRTG